MSLHSFHSYSAYAPQPAQGYAQTTQVKHGKGVEFLLNHLFSRKTRSREKLRAAASKSVVKSCLGVSPPSPKCFFKSGNNLNNPPFFIVVNLFRADPRKAKFLVYVWHHHAGGCCNQRCRREKNWGKKGGIAFWEMAELDRGGGGNTFFPGVLVAMTVRTLSWLDCKIMMVFKRLT